MSYFGNPNFSVGDGVFAQDRVSFGSMPMPKIAGALDYTKIFKDNPMFNYDFQTETGNSTGAPPETAATTAKAEDPGGLLNDPGLLEILRGRNEREKIYMSPEYQQQMGDVALDFEKRRLAIGKPYKLMEKIPDMISKGFEANARNIALQGAMLNAGSTDIAAIMAGTRIPLAAIPGAGSYQSRQQYFQ